MDDQETSTAKTTAAIADLVGKAKGSAVLTDQTASGLGAVRAKRLAVLVVQTASGLGTVGTIGSAVEALGVEFHKIDAGNITGIMQLVKEGLDLTVAGWAAASVRKPCVILIDECGHAQRMVVAHLVTLINANEKPAGTCGVVLVTHGAAEDMATLARDTLGTLVGRNIEIHDATSTDACSAALQA